MNTVSSSTSKTPSGPFTTWRTFNVPRETMWKAWTEHDRLRRWFGTKGIRVPIANLDFRPGGLFHHCMETPDGR